jgi:hypothetical protein
MQRLPPLFNQEEWQALKRQIEQVKQSEPMLRKYGYWPVPGTDDDDELKDGR